VPLKRAHSDRVERGALQVEQGAAGCIGVKHPGRRRGRAFGAYPHSHRGQRRREVAIEAVIGG